MSNQLEQHAPRGSGQIIFLLAALIIIAAGLKSAQEIMVPFLLAAFIATIAATPMFWIRAKGVPAGIALALVVVGLHSSWDIDHCVMRVMSCVTGLVTRDRY